MATGGTDTDILSDETFDFLCTVCKRKGKNTEAKKFCTDCHDYYCLICVKVHDEVPSLTGHQIVDNGQFQKGSTKKLLVVPTERCDKHGFKPVDMYCPSHDEVGCSTCIAAEHRLCQGMFYIPEYIQTTASTFNPQDIEKTLESNEESSKDLLKHLEQKKQQAMKRQTESIQNIRHFRKEINKRLDELEQTSVAEIEEKYKVLISKIENEITALQDAKRDLVSAQDKLAAAGNNISQIFVSTKMGQSVAREAEGVLHRQKVSCYYLDISFTAHPKLLEMFEQLKSMGKVTEQSLLRGMKKYSVTDQSKFRGCISSSCVLEDGTVILADSWINELKRVDRSTYSVREQYNLPESPCQVCAISNQEVAISYRAKEILLISLGNKMTKKSLIKTDFNCYGLAYANDNLYISDYGKCVYIYTVSGCKLKQYVLENEKVQPQQESSFTTRMLQNMGFSKPMPNVKIIPKIESLAVSKDGSKIYVAHGDEGLKVLDKNGEVVWKYKGQKLKCAYGVYLTSSGNVLVFGGYSYPVLQFGPDGNLMGEVLKPYSGSGACKTVCCNQQMSKMIMGGGRNEIEVYDLV